jgi:hypothetical protein
MELIVWIVVAVVVLVLMRKVLLELLRGWNDATARGIEAATRFADSPPDGPAPVDAGLPVYSAAIRPALMPEEEVEAIFDCSPPHWRDENLRRGITYLTLLAITSKRLIQYNQGKTESIPHKVITSIKLGAAMPQRDGKHQYVWRSLEIETKSSAYQFYMYQQDGRRAHDMIMNHLL